MKHETLRERKRREEEQRTFIEGLERYRKRGVRILIDGRECRPEDYRRLFACEGRCFYMGDYIGDETGKLKEIHFDRVYSR